ncbi:fibro-slime domain-containing protein [Agathobacter sp.]
MKTAKLVTKITALLLMCFVTISSLTVQINAEEGTKDENVIVNMSTKDITVTLLHYSENEKIYSDDSITLVPGQIISGYDKATNWDVDHVVMLDGQNEQEVSDRSEIKLYDDASIKVYYSKKTSQISGETVFYDYLVKPYDDRYNAQPQKSINTSANYPENSKKNNRFAIGTASQNFHENQYNTYVNKKNINAYTSGQGKSAKKTGIITGLSDDYKDVIFSVDEPGCFSDETKAGKSILTGYKLYFDRDGDSYTLKSVNDPNGKHVANAGNDFFPLDGAASNVYDGGGGSAHNYYFGMRYDIEFTLGDYVGPLNYSFTGDDDLWVILDGKKVVIDLGGIHDALTDTVDLWQYLGLKQGIGATDDDQKNAVHRLTVLYMERGANLSNCQMSFTIPSAKIVTPGITVRTGTELKSLKTAKLLNWDDRTYTIQLGAFATTENPYITDEYLTGAVVKDYIAPEFDLAGDDGKVIDEEMIKSAGDGGIVLNNGGTAKYDDTNHMVYVVWNDQAVPYDNSGTNLWQSTFTVKAKDSFIGGNNIATNDATLSGVSAVDPTGAGIKTSFPQPRVNVKMEFSVTDTENTIFLGQYVSVDNSILDGLCAYSTYDGSDPKTLYPYSSFEKNGFGWDWYSSESLSTDSKTDTTAMAADQATEIKDKLYYLDVYRSAGEPTDESNANSTVDGTVYVNGTADSAYTVHALKPGVYTTHVVDGTLTIQKVFNGNFLDGLGYSQKEKDLIDAKQTAVFTVYQYAADADIDEVAAGNANVINSFQITISDGDRPDNKVEVKGLPEGVYRVCENTDWSWKYKLESIKETEVKDGLNNTADGIFYIGPDHEKNGTVFTNVLDEAMKKIYSDTTNVLNIFK